jgi:hypothetical protein
MQIFRLPQFKHGRQRPPRTDVYVRGNLDHMHSGRGHGPDGIPVGSGGWAGSVGAPFGACFSPWLHATLGTLCQRTSPWAGGSAAERWPSILPWQLPAHYPAERRLRVLGTDPGHSLWVSSPALYWATSDCVLQVGVHQPAVGVSLKTFLLPLPGQEIWDSIFAA